MDSKISEIELKRIWGVFYGHIIGDALGCRYELQNADTVRKNIHEDKRVGFWGLFKKIALPILGGGPGHMKPGQVSINQRKKFIDAK